jgi:hypothetical protein
MLELQENLSISNSGISNSLYKQQNCGPNHFLYVKISNSLYKELLIFFFFLETLSPSCL